MTLVSPYLLVTTQSINGLNFLKDIKGLDKLKATIKTKAQLYAVY